MTQVQAGLLREFENLSIWEIAHRWHDIDPNLSDPLNPPLPAQDIIRAFSRALLISQIHYVDSYGVIHANENNVPPLERYVPAKFRPRDMPFAITAEEDSTINYAELMDPDELYQEHDELVELYRERHLEKVEPLYECRDGRKFARDVLEEIHLRRRDVLGYCRHFGLIPPRFWYTEEEITANSVKPSEKDEPDLSINRGPHAIRDQDRERCRLIAETMWLMEPTLTIEDIVKHEAIQRLGNGALYPGRDTIRNWIKNLDPRPPENRVGRPAKKRGQ